MGLAPFQIGREADFEQLITEMMDEGYGQVLSFVPDYLISGLRSIVLEKIDQGKLRPAGVGNNTTFARNTSIRSDLICWIEKNTENPFEQEFLSLVQGFVYYLNRTCYTGIHDFEFHYAAYEAGTFYKRHKDQFKTDDRRQFSMITYLNDDWHTKDGGALVLYPETAPVAILPEGGKTVFFRSDQLEHEVLTAHRLRLSITGWLKR
ncbi:MAG TPA: 2OG-Fe(II) oxygenase [Saprospiraceae bacterium]|nr:2OG-Fe(II) oxygenase [Saprospiraceae bacterium]HMQ83165.1 2OG-Fe(II) oxygenase [Saprospiraceae bacterium]